MERTPFHNVPTEPVRSAEPPNSSGKAGANSSRVSFEEMRLAWAAPAFCRAAAVGGINVNSVIMRTALLSGGLAGMAGVGEVVAIHFHLLMDISPGFGYSGIVIAMLGRLHPVGVALSAFFFSVVIVGAQSMSRLTGVPVYIAEVIQGMALMVMLIALLLTEYRIKAVRS